ncbi:MAG TPA: nuclear transport factor 2 family protein [Acidimicrobiales bacterium]|nr:nuclear transport factor 2 family protein [Acidimicrobiales bacterium]
MTDGDRIRNLLGRYCDLMDAGDWLGIGALFARGRLVTDDGTELAAGAAAVAEFYARGTRLHDGSPRTKHIVANTVLGEPGDDGSVVARSSYLVLQAVEGRPLQPIITGRYVDRFGRVDVAGEAPADGFDEAGWHFVERAFAVDLVGDLGDHLRFAL